MERNMKERGRSLVQGLNGMRERGRGLVEEPDGMREGQRYKVRERERQTNRQNDREAKGRKKRGGGREKQSSPSLQTPEASDCDAARHSPGLTCRLA